MTAPAGRRPRIAHDNSTAHGDYGNAFGQHIYKVTVDARKVVSCILGLS